MSKRLGVMIVALVLTIVGSAGVVSAIQSECYNTVIIYIPGEGWTSCDQFCRYYDNGGQYLGWSCASAS